MGNVNETVYDAVGNEAQHIDAKGRITAMDYDAYGRLIETRYPDGTFETKSYDAEGNLLTEMLASTGASMNSRTTTYEYDKLNRRIKTTFPDGASTQTEYDAAGQVIAEIDERGNRTEYEYDLAGRRILTRDALGHETHFEYDADGNLVKQADANGHVTQYEYNALDQKVKTVFHDGTSMQEKYDALGRVTEKTDQAGVSTKYEYDKLGRLTKVINANGGETRYTYDEAGNKLTQTDANLHTTRWEYDSQGRVTARTLPGGQRETMVYDEVGNLIGKTDFNGRTTTYEYDLNDRLVRTLYADGTEESFTYDAVGNRLTATDVEGTISWTYDARNRVTSETQPDGTVIEYQYDAAGNKTEEKFTMQTDAGSQIAIKTFEYDALNRLLSVTDEQGATVYTYDSVGNRQSVTNADGNVTRYTYDGLNRLTEQSTRNSSNTVILRYSYTLAPAGRRTRVEELNGRVSNYQYDNLYRLTQEFVTDPANGDYSALYSYDAVGNRTQSIIDGVTTAYSYDVNDRLLQQGGTTYTYDNNGNTLTEVLGSDTKVYQYNSKNKLIKVTAASGDEIDYTYDVDEHRTEKTENGITTRYLVDRNRQFAQVMAELTNGNLEVVYTHGDDLISQTRNGKTSYYLYDGLGSVRTLTDETGEVTDTYHYDAFGVELARTGTTENSYLYTGEQFDGTLNQYYLRARYYNQKVGRFTQMDTFEGLTNEPLTLHKYLYANADPVNNTDPSGNLTYGEITFATGLRVTLAVAAATYGVSLLDSLTGLDKPTSLDLNREPTLKDVQIGKFQVKRCAVSGDANCKANIPVIIFGSDVQEVTDHIFDAQTIKGISPILSRGVVNSRTWLRSAPECKGLTKRGVSDCDEYPFASTQQGGRSHYPTGVSLRVIDASQNRSAGARVEGFGGLYRTCDVRINDPVKKWFGVVVAPSAPTTTPICAQ